MNQKLQNIFDLIQQSEKLDAGQKENLFKALKDADKELEITAFKLERTEKVKRTTAILLEETIEELEQKRKAVEAQNHELEIEASLERVRAVAMSMMKPEDMLEVCKIIAQQLAWLNVKEIRNVQTAIFYNEKGIYANYEYYVKHDKMLVTDTEFRNHPVAEKFANQMMGGANEIFIHGFTGPEVKEWLEYQKGTNVFIDPYLETADSLNYYWYSLGPVALGMSAYVALKEEGIELFKRFRNVFELAYRRYLDIEKAEAQAREAQIEAALERVRSRTMGMQKSDELAETVSVLFRQLLQLGVQSAQLRTCGIVTFNEDKPEGQTWITNINGDIISDPFIIPFNEAPAYKSIYAAWKKGEKFMEIHLKDDAFFEHMNYLKKTSAVPNINMDEIKEKYNQIFFHVIFFARGYLFVISYESLPGFHDI
ncbi:MAG: hypothetical protein JSU05_04860, partial [Bacteroidetes bacterium]|nr:hypothetical protein [Bacteroidota bacterium]